MLSSPSSPRSPPLSLQPFLPSSGDSVTEDALLDRFLAWCAAQNLTLYPAQEEALLALFAKQHVILTTPTGSGKSLVATACLFYAYATQGRALYTCPIKALASEQWLSFCGLFGPEAVGLLTGDATVNPTAPLLCCTAEVLANMALREGASLPVAHVVMDEFHYYADRERGIAWQIPLLTLPHTRFLLMSATLGPTERFEQTLTRHTGVPTAVIRAATRPVPLDFSYRETPLHETVLELLAAGQAPLYLVHFTQRACAETAQALRSLPLCTKEEKLAIATALYGFRFDSPYGKEIQTLLRHGVGLHHAGLLPKYRLLIEQLAQTGRLKVLCGTDTLGVGVNIPLRTVVLTQLCKFGGEKSALLNAREFQQISGRAGRKGFDDQGSVVVQAPEHVIENLRMESKAEGDPKKLRKLVKRKPPTKGYVPWDRTVFERLLVAPCEPLASSFQVTHGLVLQLLQRERGGAMALARLIRDSHTTLSEKRKHGKTALMILRSLMDAGIVCEIPAAERNRGGRRFLVHTALQEDFSLHQTHALYLVDTLRLLDPTSPTYALDVLTLVESILENPGAILTQQVEKAKQIRLAEMKAAGVPYEERIEELETIEHPKPNREFLYQTFNAFAAAHPWIDNHQIRPKSIAREMVEQCLSFAEYVRTYHLERAEGVLLRYLSNVYSVLVQTVPSPDKTEALQEVIDSIGAVVRQTDASLLLAWQRLCAPALLSTTEQSPSPVSIEEMNLREVHILLRNTVMALLRFLARRDATQAAQQLAPPPDAEAPWNAARLEAALSLFFAEHNELRLDAEARNPRYLQVKAQEGWWHLTQVLLDDEGATEWVLQGRVSREELTRGQPQLELHHFGPI